MDATAVSDPVDGKLLTIDTVNMASQSLVLHSAIYIRS